MLRFVLPVVICTALAQGSFAQQTPASMKKTALADLQAGQETYRRIALQIWDWAEVGFKEYKSTALLQKTLAQQGFQIDTGVAGIPTAFVATYGHGKPVIGILAEYDALPGMGQDSVAGKKILGAKRPVMPAVITCWVRPVWLPPSRSNN